MCQNAAKPAGDVSDKGIEVDRVDAQFLGRIRQGWLLREQRVDEIVPRVYRDGDGPRAPKGRQPWKGVAMDQARRVSLCSVPGETR